MTIGMCMRAAWTIVAVSMAVIGGLSCSADGNGGGADRALISSTAGKALSRLQDSAAMLGKGPLPEPIEGSISPYLVALQEVAQSFPDAAGDNRKVINSLTYVGMGLTTVNAAQAVGGVALTAPYTSESRVLDELLKNADEKGVEDFSPDKLTEETSRLLRMLGQITVFGDKALTDQIVPTDSPLRVHWDKDQDGKFEIPLPPVDLPEDTSAWQDFSNDLTFERDRGSLIGRILLEISYTAERLQLRLT
jgi:hypothetical protein